MTTLPGLASKGEKGKSKYQSLDINSLYRSSRGEKEETQQQKNTLPRKHGMQILGRVPNARRPPANLPSLKSEHSGSDTAVSLVPSGGPGWGKQDTPTQGSQGQAVQGSSTSPAGPQGSGAPPSATGAQGVPSPAQNVGPQQIAPPPVVQTNATSPKQPPVQSLSVAQPASVVGTDKSWSAVMAGADLGIGQPPPYHSAQFQHEFPSLDGGTGSGGPSAGAPGGGIQLGRGGVDMQYGPGPSLRPQTEGSWMQGGSRATCGAGQVAETGQPMVGTTAGGKANSGQQGVPPQHMGQGGQQQGPPGSGGPIPGQPQEPPPQFRGLLPNFMCRGNFAPNEHGSSNFQTATNPLSGRGRFPTPQQHINIQQQQHMQHSGGESRPPPPHRGGPPPPESDDPVHRPIIKEEDLHRMDDMTRDVGWASHDDIDYNQKLAFSDDEQQAEHSHRDNREREREREKEYSQHRNEERRDIHKKPEPVEKMEPVINENRAPQMMPNRGWNNPRQQSQPATPQQNRNQQNRRNEDEEIWEQRRRQQSEEVAIAVERAKLRKEEEEKRYLETKQAAAKKLQELENKIKEKKGEESIREVNENESQGTINPSQIPPQPITPAPIPVPEWERDRETRERERSRTPNETTEKHPQHPTREADFRQLTQIEGRNFLTKNSRSSEREISRDRDVRDREPRDNRERDIRDRDRDNRERDAPNFSRHFQSNLPPRFQKQQAERQNTTGNYHRGGQSGSPQPQNTPNPNPNVPFAQQYDPRWVQNNSNFPVKNPNSNNPRRKDDHENESHHTNNRERRDRHTPDTERTYERDSNRRISGGDRYYDDYRNYRREGSQEYEYKHDRSEEKWEKDHRGHYNEDRKDKKEDSFDSHDIHRQDSGEWRREKYISHKESSEERSSDRNQDSSQRPDSRDSRISKDSLRDVNEYTCWADSPFEPTYEDNKKKETYREERRQVPGPITKERIEADDLKSEKRNLIQLKRSDNKLDNKKHESDKKMDESSKKKDEESKSWADQVSPQTGAAPDKLMEALEKNKKPSTAMDTQKKEVMSDKDKDDKHSSSRIRMDSRGSNSHRGNWGSSGTGTVYNSSWPKRGDGRLSRGSQRTSGRRHKDMLHSDSEFSGDEFSISTESGKEDRSNKHLKSNQSPKPHKKSDKDDKNKDKQLDKGDIRRSDKRFETHSRDRDRDRNRDPYIPRGEPTRHGRGGFRGPRPMVSSKRIDGYGIPPSKSPFGNHDEKDMKKHHSGDEIGGEAVSSDEKTKLNQQALAAGIIGGSRNPKMDGQVPPRIQRQKDERRDRDRSKGRAHSGSRKPKPRSKHSDENWETSDYSDTDDRKDRGKRKLRINNPSAPYQSSRGSNAPLSNNRSNTNQTNNPRRDNIDPKKSSFGNKNEPNLRQNSNTNLRNTEKGTGKTKEDGKETNTFAAAIENVKQQTVKEKIERSFCF